jgi:hypothetical protein
MSWQFSVHLISGGSWAINTTWYLDAYKVENSCLPVEPELTY